MHADFAIECIAQLQSAYGFDEKQVISLYQTLAASMHAAVRLGSMPSRGLARRWGYGWPVCD